MYVKQDDIKHTSIMKLNRQLGTNKTLDNENIKRVTHRQLKINLNRVLIDKTKQITNAI